MGSREFGHVADDGRDGVLTKVPTLEGLIEVTYRTKNNFFDPAKIYMKDGSRTPMKSALGGNLLVN